MKVLVTGRAGSGKSAVTTELKSRGFNAIDTDEIVGLSSWQDIQSGKLVTLADTTYVDLSVYRWVWDANKLHEVLQVTRNLFVCGGADNDLSFYDLFDHHFVLDVPPALQIERLQSRTNNDYGRDPRMFDKIVAREAAHVKDACKLGAVVLDASLPINQVVDNLLSNL